MRTLLKVSILLSFSLIFQINSYAENSCASHAGNSVTNFYALFEVADSQVPIVRPIPGAVEFILDGDLQIAVCTKYSEQLKKHGDTSHCEEWCLAPEPSKHSNDQNLYGNNAGEIAEICKSCQKGNKEKLCDSLAAGITNKLTNKSPIKITDSGGRNTIVEVNQDGELLFFPTVLSKAAKIKKQNIEKSLTFLLKELQKLKDSIDPNKVKGVTPAALARVRKEKTLKNKEIKKIKREILDVEYFGLPGNRRWTDPCC